MIKIETTNGKQLSYRKVGQGPALVLIHGFPENGGLWRHVWPNLAAKFTVIIPDLPGTGESQLLSGTTMETVAQTIADIFTNEGLPEAVIVGHSMGGYVALAFAEQFPGKVKGLSLVHSAASADNEEKKETRRKSISLIRKGGKEPFIKQMIPNLFPSSFIKMHGSVLEEQVERGLELDADSMIAFYEAMIERPDRTHILKNANFPVQFILGEEDAVIPFDLILPQSRLSSRNFVSLYSNTGHMSMIENPQRLSGDLIAFADYCFMHH